MSPLNSYVSGHGRQRGAIGLLAAMTLALAVLCMLVVVDSGRLYLEKRSLQRVADVAALEAASRKGNCLIATALDKQAATYVSQSALRNGFTVNLDGRALSTHCGSLAIDSNGRRTFTADSSKTEAIQVTVSHSVPRSIAAGIGAMFDTTPTPVDVQLSATAVAAQAPPLAALTIRSTLLTVDSAQANLLDPLIGGLVGGSINLGVAGWQSLLNTDVNLFSYLDRLKADIGITAIDYKRVLSTDIAVSQLIQSTINVLDPAGTLNGSTQIASLQALKVAVGATSVVLGDILQIKGTTDTSALTTNLQLYDLVQAFAQLANKKNGLVAQVPVNLAGLAQITAQVRVIEPPQLSAIGDPQLAASDSDPRTGPNRIYVQTAQVRTLLSVNLPALSAISPVLTAATDLAAPLAGTVESLLHLDIKGVLNSLTCALLKKCLMLDILPLDFSRIDVSLDASSAESYVTGYSCASPTSKSLTTNTKTAIVNLKIGKMDNANLFPAGTPAPPPPPIILKPLAVVDIGTKACQRFLTLPIACDPRTPSIGGGLGISADISVGQSVPTSVTYNAPYLPEISQLPTYQSFSTTNTINSLTNTVKGVTVNAYTPVANNPLGNLLTGLSGTLSIVTDELNNAITKVLSPLLDSLLNNLLSALGINLNQVDVGANLSCNFGQATLVI